MSAKIVELTVTLQDTNMHGYKVLAACLEIVVNSLLLGTISLACACVCWSCTLLSIR